MPTPDTCPTLTYLARCYFHQDFRLEYAGATAALEDFLASEPEDAALIAAEVDRALAEHPTEGQARRFVLDDLDSYYRVEADGLTYRAWLQSIADRARELGY